MAGIKVLQGVETALTTRRRPVKVGLVVDERAHSPGIALGMHARPFAGLEACSIVEELLPRGVNCFSTANVVPQ